MMLFADTDLFTSGEVSTKKYDAPDAKLVLFESFFDRDQADHYYHHLMTNTHWKQHEIMIYGKTLPTPRLSAWYGDREYAFSGKTLHPHSWTPELLHIKEKAEQHAEVTFNSVLLNLYRGGQDSVSWHRDDEPELGRNPVIASVSFGETRPFRLRHKFRKDIQQIEIPLTHGSYLLMAGATQHYWEHQVPKTSKPVKPRINLTFRLIK
jgi:alkylated DNA repair dioxygenase AlkB